MKIFLKKVSVLLLSTLIVSCSSQGIIGDYWDLLPSQIDSFSTFIKAWFILLIIDFSCSTLLSITIGLRGRLVTIILFFLVLFKLDYGFFKTVLLFLFSGIILYLISYIWKTFISKQK
jgi:hypothetical protein